jgi:serine/threonine-protein kinase/endoribonuclease IRE1
LNHPLFRTSERRLSFVQDVSDRVELEDRENESELLNALESTATLALTGKWDEKMEEAAFIDNIGCYRRYTFDSVRDLLRVVRNKSHHCRECKASHLSQQRWESTMVVKPSFLSHKL